jgi:Ni/Fe-hydrogenase b-type cytochrome subunit
MTGSTGSEPAGAGPRSSWRAPEALRFTGSAVHVRAAYEHPWLVRMTHWLTAVSVFVLVGSGLQIFTAFPSFGPKLPQHDLLNVPEALRLGGWLAGALQWHFTFMWIFMATGLAYLGYQALSGRYRMVLFGVRDVPGVWPMVRHYLLRRARPPVTAPYNPLQKLAYTSSILFGAASVLTGLVLFNPVQFSSLAWAMGGFSLARLWHFLAMCGLLVFVAGHLVMVAIHGWKNFMSMVVGWKRDPEYALEPVPAGGRSELLPRVGPTPDAPAPPPIEPQDADVPPSA